MKFCLTVLFFFCVLIGCQGSHNSCDSDKEKEKKGCEKFDTWKIILIVVICVTVIVVIVVVVVYCYCKKKNAKRVSDMELNQIHQTQTMPPPYFAGQQSNYPGSSDQAGPLPAKN